MTEEIKNQDDMHGRINVAVAGAMELPRPDNHIEISSASAVK